MSVKPPSRSPTLHRMSLYVCIRPRVGATVDSRRLRTLVPFVAGTRSRWLPSRLRS